MSNKVAIYGLVDPETSQIRYVGQSTNPHLRLSQHLAGSDVQPNHPKAIWFKTLKAQKLVPGLVIIEYVDPANANAAEEKWIRFYAEQGNSLTNVMSMLRYEINPSISGDRERLLDFMNQNSFNLSDLALIMGVAVSGICQYLNGQRDIPDGFKWRFAATFGWPIATKVFPFNANPDNKAELTDDE